MSFKLFDDSWEFTTLGNLIDTRQADIQTGPFGTMLKASSYKSNGTPVIAVKDIGINRIIHGQSPLIDNLDADRLSRYKLIKGDIVFGRKGAVDRRALITEKEEGWLQGSDCIRLRFNNSAIDPVYVSYFLGTKYYTNWIISNAQGTTMASLNQEILKRVPLPLPPVKEQKAIASILKKLDNKIELNYAINENLEEMAQSIFKRWFVDFEFPNEDSGSYKSNGGEFEESEMGPIPAGWSVVRLSELMDIQGGTQPPSTEFIDHYRPGYVRLIQIRDYESDKHVTYIPDKPSLKKTVFDDIMIGRYGAAVGRILWGLEGAYNVALVKVICDKPIYREFLRTYLSSDDFQQRLIAMSGRSAQAGFNKGDIASFKIAKPEDSLFFKYNQFTWLLRKNCYEIKQENEKLTQLRDTLLPKLMSGQIRVPIEQP